MKKFTAPCQFGAQTAPFTIYIGKPKRENHPIQNQANWLSKERGGKVPEKVMNSLEKLRDLAEKNNVSFEELCVYALTAAAKKDEEETSAQEATDDQSTNNEESDAEEANSTTSG